MMLQAVGEQMTIVAQRFVLRPAQVSDVGLYALHAGDLRVAVGTSSIPHPLPPGAAEAFIARAMNPLGDERVWVMDGMAHGMPELMGVISLKQMGRNQSEIEYWVAPAFWNTGYASEAVWALILANPLKNSAIFAQVFQDNPGSARVLTNCGFGYLGDAESFSVARNAGVQTWTYLRAMV